MFLQSSPNARLDRIFRDLRHLLRPLAVSLLGHALILWQAPGLLPAPEPGAARQGDMHARLQQAPVAAPRVEQPPPSPSEPAETAPARQPEERRYAPTPSEPPPGEAAAEQTAPDNRAAPPVESPSTGIDVAGLRQYHLALGQKAKQFRRYPPAAREAGWQGRVAMRIAISEAGTPISIKLLGSSDFPVLDQAALEMMFLAASHTEVPESLRGRAFTIDLAVDFKPDDAQ